MAFEKNLFLGTYGNMLNANNNLKLLNAYTPKNIKYIEKYCFSLEQHFWKLKLGDTS